MGLKTYLGRAGAAGLAALMIGQSGIAFADPLGLGGKSDDEWRFSVQPYLFAPVSTTGTSTVAGGSVDLDLNLKDLLNYLNFMASGRVEAWKGDFGLIIDAYYVNIGGDETIGLPAGGTVGVDVDMKQFWFDLLGAYRVAHGAYDETGRRYAIDLQAGVRYNRLRQEIDADVSVDIGPRAGFQKSLGGTEDWFEPVVGVRGMAQISDRWTIGARADFGGFGVGDDDLQWKVIAGFDYRAWERTSVKFGWQFYGIDYSTNRSDGKFAYDVFMTGPYMALTFRF
ncbi:MAG: hypothetical protein O7I42_21110 [Alphaproteobacteria bacterium]|nr:hypothetical protein [Alphaproteobacteria bacterium]